MSSDASTMKTLRAIEDADKGTQNEITLSTGVVLRAKKAKPMYLISVMTRFPRPKPPTYFVEAMGREMENPDDPDYLDRVAAYEQEKNAEVLNALLVLGTELVKTPKGMPKPEDDEWLDTVNALNMPSHPKNKAWRYLTWLKLVGTDDENDLVIIQEAVSRLSGIREDDVKATENFPGSDR